MSATDLRGKRQGGREGGTFGAEGQQEAAMTLRRCLPGHDRESKEAGVAEFQ